MGPSRPAVVPGAPSPQVQPARRQIEPGTAVWGTLGVGAALLVAVAWIPLRSSNPDVDVALALVVVITALGATGRRSAVAATAVSAAVSFTYFDTTPYDRFSVARLPDVVTAVLLFVVGLATGELAVRVARQHQTSQTEIGDLGRVREVASLLAHGEELVVMIGSVADELARLLGLQECWFAAEPIEPGARCVERDGQLRRWGGDSPIVRSAYRQPDQLALPVWGQGQVLGHFVLDVRPGTLLRREQLQVAFTLADQAGAALFAQAPPNPPILRPGQGPPLPPAADAPVPRLRVVRGGGREAGG